MKEDKEFPEEKNEEALSEEEAKKLYNRIQELLKAKKPRNNGKVNGKTPAQKKQEKKSRKINRSRANQKRKFSGKNHRK